MNIDDITWDIKVNNLIKNKKTGLVTSVTYTYSGSYEGYSSFVDKEQLGIPYKDPSDEDFIAFENLSQEDMCSWIDTQINVCPEFDVELLRFDGLISDFTKEIEITEDELVEQLVTEIQTDEETGEEIEVEVLRSILQPVTKTITVVDEDHPLQPKNQDLSNFKFSSRKEQLQLTIMNTIKDKMTISKEGKEEEVVHFD